MLASAELHQTLLELTFLFGLCIVVSMVFLRMRMPPVVGYLAAGALVGPNGFGLVPQVGLVEQLAEIGVVVLLFTVGMELSIGQLARIKNAVLIGGGLQIVVTIALAAAALHLMGLPVGQAVFVGYILTLSSTAAITKLLSDRGEVGSPAGRLAIAVCVAQDLAVVPMVLTLPLLARWGGEDSAGAGSAVLETVGDLAGTLGLFALLGVVSWVLVPRVLDAVSRTRSRELYLLAVLASCLVIALATSVLGMSLALGAFLAGVVLGSSDHHHQAAAEVEPFRDALGSLFFVSIGMLFDGRTIVDEPIVVVGALLAVVVAKAVIAASAIRTLKMPLWTAVRSGLMVAQVGEFSFVIVTLGSQFRLLSERQGRVFLVVAVLSIAMTPLLFALGRKVGRTRSEERRPRRDLEDHVVIVGFGPIGQGLATSLAKLSIPYRIIELNAETVKRGRTEGLPIVRGDASKRLVLDAVGIRRARMLVVATNEPNANRKVVETARRMAPNLHVLARASYLGEVPVLEDAGADEIVPQELETGVEMVARTLRHYLVPDDEVGSLVDGMRSAAYANRKVARGTTPNAARLSQYVPGLRVVTFRVEPGAKVAGRALGETHLRRDTQLSVVAVVRGEETTLGIGPETRLEAEDIVVGIGSEGAAEAAAIQFRGPGRVGVAVTEPTA